MKFHIRMPGLNRYPPNFSPWEAELTSSDMQMIARKLEGLGFDALSVAEHIAMPRELARRMSAHWPDAITAMSFLAGATENIRMLSSIIVLPYHNPVVLAKAVSTLDQLSGGRLTLGFGLGHAEQEFASLGISFRERAGIMNESLGALIELWTAEEPRFQGRHVNFDDVAFAPKPVQLPYPPIWIGGHSQAALRRAARFGDGWLISRMDLAQLDESLEYLRSQPGFAAKESRFDILMPINPMPPGRYEPWTAEELARQPKSREQLIDRIGVMADHGVTWTIAPLPAGEAKSLSHYLDRASRAAEEVMSAFR